MVVRCLMFFLPFIYLFFLSPLYLLALIYLPTSCLNEFFLIPPHLQLMPMGLLHHSLSLPCHFPVLFYMGNKNGGQQVADRKPFIPHTKETRCLFFFILVHPTQTHSVPQSRSPFALVDNHGFNCSWLRTNNPILKIASLSKSSNNRQIFFKFRTVCK